jgi:ubiquitin-activating enzyme E1
MVHVFDNPLSETLDVIINALNNVNALLYMDSHCVYFQKPLSESNTLGTKCNTHMVIPNMTKLWGIVKSTRKASIHVHFPFIPSQH